MTAGHSTGPPRDCTSTKCFEPHNGATVIQHETASSQTAHTELGDGYEQHPPIGTPGEESPKGLSSQKTTANADQGGGTRTSPWHVSHGPDDAKKRVYQFWAEVTGTSSPPQQQSKSPTPHQVLRWS
eukprot:CAMPEP_0204258502 /NCGR_PEP_ID=MMETSP0468-20130131/5014_1 /ASSEMBLY_ACC=CAM_ASM_000383 /TAXON_ID=2969 /ORGANISM="Oxyrrhis marina" /LENGTH=126 /DNA_ID=CAMNT_0051232689 /DNA_START=278 /DNA_END=657 /DNA_ORIENTATION=+